MNHGLPPAVVAAICGVLARHPEVDRAVLFGSRAKGGFKGGSDIDLTLSGNDLTPAKLAEIEDELDDLLLPYGLDLSIYERLAPGPLRAQIDRQGQEFYCREDVAEPRPSRPE